jgi:AmmeMemoRadiSam system protein A
MSFPHPNSTAPDDSPTQTAGEESGEFSQEERVLLLKVAHEAIESAVNGREGSFDPPSPHLAEPRGAFTTLYLSGQLRGCVGYVLPILPVYRAVAETARAAAEEDSRFEPVRPEEAAQLEISLSILSLLQPVAAAQVEIGRHGLVVTMAGRRGLLLPQVPVEHHWDRITFLEQTCRKAGLPMDAWQRGATLESFTAEVFGDAEFRKLA